MAALIGRHTNKIDTKGRISVPKAFRDALFTPVLKERGASDLFSGVYLYRSFEYPSIEGCGEMFIQRIIASLDKLELFSDKQHDLAVTLLENSYEIAYDTEGRILLPTQLRAYAGLSEEAVFVGRGTRFQIWEPGAYKIHNHKAFERIKAHGAMLQFKISQDEVGL